VVYSIPTTGLEAIHVQAQEIVLSGSSWIRMQLCFIFQLTVVAIILLDDRATVTFNQISI